ncbi:MAG: hypothetical protein N2663_03125 [Chlorobi bacterium]|nr:hypothetical protein [Chlorobiota bacterium]
MLRRAFALLLAALVIILSFPYAATPVYDLVPLQPQAGSQWFNPYSSTDSTWLKANVHLHSYAWFGTTDGRRNSIAAIDSAYRALGYTVLALSNYQRIDSLGYRWPHIPCYEHGYNIQKTHQLVLGARSVVWFDCLLPQSVFVKQWILDLLRPTAEVLIAAHPSFGRPSYRLSDMTLLSNYDCLEVFNHYRTSLAHWDSALSSGIIVWAVGNDDCHDVTREGETGVCLTVVAVPQHWIPQNLYQAYREGRTIAVRTRHAQLPVGVPHQRIAGDSLIVEAQSNADSIRFISDGGRTVAQAHNTNRASCFIDHRLHYIRAEIFSGETMYALNPIIRTANGQPARHRRLIENLPLTVLYRVLWVLIYANALITLRRWTAR